MTQLCVYSQTEGQCVISAISKANELKKQKTLKAGLHNIIEVTAAGNKKSYNGYYRFKSRLKAVGKILLRQKFIVGVIIRKLLVIIPKLSVKSSESCLLVLLAIFLANMNT